MSAKTKSDVLNDTVYIGIGGCGRAILKSWRERLPHDAFCMAIDRDKDSFIKSNECEHQLCLAKVKSKGSSLEYIDSAREEVQTNLEDYFSILEELVGDRRNIVLLAGLGGVIGTWATQTLSTHFIGMGKQVVTLLVMPFSFETNRLRVAEAALPKFHGLEHRILCFNDYSIKHTPDNTSLTDAFDLMNEKAFELLVMPE